MDDWTYPDLDLDSQDTQPPLLDQDRHAPGPASLPSWPRPRASTNSNRPRADAVDDPEALKDVALSFASPPGAAPAL